jgi:hypothetical protein
LWPGFCLYFYYIDFVETVGQVCLSRNLLNSGLAGFALSLFAGASQEGFSTQGTFPRVESESVKDVALKKTLTGKSSQGASTEFAGNRRL